MEDVIAMVALKMPAEPKTTTLPQGTTGLRVILSALGLPQGYLVVVYEIKILFQAENFIFQMPLD